MAIAYDASSSGGNTGTGTLTVSHTCTGNDRMLVVSASAAVPNGVAISGVTYAGVSMTLVDTIAIQANVTQRMFYLLNPASGANNIVLSVTGASGSTAKRLAAASYTGVKQSAQPDASTKTGPVTTSTITGTLTTIADKCWLIASGHGNTSVGAGTGTTQRAAQDGVTGVFDSSGEKSPAGSYSLQVTNGGADNGGIIVASFAPAMPSFSVSDTVTPAETVTALRTRLFSVSETATISESVTAALGRIFSAADTAAVTDAVTALRSRVFSALDALAVTEPVVYVKKLWETVARAVSSFTRPPSDGGTWTRPDNPNAV